MSTSNYAPELFEVFRKGARESFEMVCPDARSAYQLRARLNKLRVEMRKEGHYMLEAAEATQLVIDTRKRPQVVVAGPVDTRYLQIIRDTIGEPTLEAVTASKEMIGATRPPPRQSQEDILNDYFGKKD